MNPAEITSFLCKSSLFSALPEEDLRRLADLLEPKEYPPGEVVIHQGDFGDSLYFICRGEVEVFVQNEEKAESVVTRLQESDFFGEMALLTGSPRSASVRVSKGASFLRLLKNDFDKYLEEHPQLAILFSKLLVERINATNKLYAHEVGRERQLKRLLSHEEEQHLTRLIGKTKQFQDVEKRILEMAQVDVPVIILGPKGTAAEDVARLIHLKSHRQDQPFIVVDISGGDEWKTYLTRARSLLKEKEENDDLFEEFQISTIFGHERGAIPGADASRLGYLEIADGGTIFLKNIDLLSPGTRERLLFYLLEKKFYRLGGSDRVEADTRVVTHLCSSDSKGNVKDFLHGKAPDTLLKNRIDLPPLSLRRRDIPLIAEAFLEKHSALAGKVIKKVSPEAMNTLVRYSWPGNDREMESVIERGVLVCDGDTLLARHIFLGLTPYSEKGRMNLLRLGSFRKVFGDIRLRGFIQGAMVAVMLGAITLTLLGPQNPGKNMGMGIIWYYWWPFLLLSFLLLGRFYCSICPIYGLTQLSRRLGSLNRPAPRVFDRINVALAGVLTLGLFWSEYLFLVKEIPFRTPILLGTILCSAVIVNFVFLPEVWCRYICPMGFFSGVFACMASVELRANNNVCSSQCKATPCYRGVENQSGCPMKLFPVALASNQFCKMCGTCVHNCPYNAIHLDLRWPGAEIWENKEPNLVTSLTIPSLVGILYALFLHESLRASTNANLSFTLLYFASAFGAVSIFMAACLTRGRGDFTGQLRTYGYVYLPLAFAGHLAFLVPYLFSGLKWLTAGTLSANFNLITTPWLQRSIIAVGIIWSLWAVRQVSRKMPFIVSWTHGALLLALGSGLFFVTRG